MLYACLIMKFRALIDDVKAGIGWGLAFAHISRELRRAHARAEASKAGNSTAPLALLLAGVFAALGGLQACAMDGAAPELAGDSAALERCAFDTHATYELAGDFGTARTTIANYVAKCAAPEQISTTCTGNVLTVRDRDYTEVWTLEAPELASVNVLAPGVDELYTVKLRAAER